MIQAGDGARFALKALAQLGTICKMCRQNLDRNDSVQPRVAGAVHLAHPARTYAGDDFVGALDVCRGGSPWVSRRLRIGAVYRIQYAQDLVFSTRVAIVCETKRTT